MYNNRIPKIAIFLDNALNKPSKFKTKNWLEVNDEARGEYSSDKLIRFKIAMLRSSNAVMITVMHIYFLKEM